MKWLAGLFAFRPAHRASVRDGLKLLKVQTTPRVVFPADPPRVKLPGPMTIEAWRKRYLQ